MLIVIKSIINFLNFYVIENYFIEKLFSTQLYRVCFDNKNYNLIVYNYQYDSFE